MLLALLMDESFPTSTSETALRQWRRIAVICALAVACSTILLAATAFLAVQSLGTHYNLYYLLWKAGMRPYERSVAFGGLLHDGAYRQRFVGMSVEQFTQTFPNTFYKVRKSPLIAKPNQEFYIDNYQLAQHEDGDFGFCWVAIFENGRLIELDLFKG